MTSHSATARPEGKDTRFLSAVGHALVLTHDAHLVDSSFGFVESTIMFVHSMALMLCGALPWVGTHRSLGRWLSISDAPQAWDISADVVQWAGLSESETWQSVVFISIVELYSIVTHLPFELYATFVIEEQFGFNKQTLAVQTNSLCCGVKNV